MRARSALRWLGVAGIVAGAALIAASLATGEGHAYLLLIFPVFTSTGALGLLGIVALFAGIAMAMFSLAAGGIPAMEAPGTAPPPAQAPPSGPSMAAPAPRLGGVVMLGPIPLVFGSDARITKWMIALGIVLLALTVAVWLFLLR